MRRRSVVLVLFLAALGCSKKPDSSPRIEITYWEKWTGFEGDAMQKVVDLFNESQDEIHVTMSIISQMDRKLLVATAGGNPPDVAGIWSWATNFYADAGAIVALDDYCATYGITAEQYIPVYWQLCQHRGHTFALPTTPGNMALHWNKRMFREAGLDPEKPPRTIEELDRYARILSKRDPKTGRYSQLGFIQAEPGWWNWAWGYFYGGQLWDGNETITVDSPENLRAFRWIRDYPTRYGVTELRNFRSGFRDMFSTPQNAFFSGLLAMEIQGVWLYNFIDKYAPGMEWGAAPFPYPEDRPDLANTTINECDILVIPKDAPHPDAAFKFIAFVQTQKAMEMLNGGHRKHVPLRKASDAFWENHPNPYIHVFRDLAYSRNSCSTSRLGFWLAYQDEMNSAFDGVWACDVTPERALGIVQERMQKRLDREIRRMKRLDLWEAIVEAEAANRVHQRTWTVPKRPVRPGAAPAALLWDGLLGSLVRRRN